MRCIINSYSFEAYNHIERLTRHQLKISIKMNDAINTHNHILDKRVIVFSRPRSFLLFLRVDPLVDVGLYHGED